MAARKPYYPPTGHKTLAFGLLVVGIMTTFVTFGVVMSDYINAKVPVVVLVDTQRYIGVIESFNFPSPFSLTILLIVSVSLFAGALFSYRKKFSMLSMMGAVFCAGFAGYLPILLDPPEHHQLYLAVNIENDPQEQMLWQGFKNVDRLKMMLPSDFLKSLNMPPEKLLTNATVSFEKNTRDEGGRVVIRYTFPPDSTQTDLVSMAGFLRDLSFVLVIKSRQSRGENPKPVPGAFTPTRKWNQKAIDDWKAFLLQDPPQP